MQQIKKAIWKLQQSLWKAGKGLAFVHDIKVLNSDYSIDYKEKSLQDEIEEEKISLIKQKELIEKESSFIISRINQALEEMEHFPKT